MSRSSREIAAFFASVAGALALLAGLSAEMARTPIGKVLLVATLLAGLLLVISLLRDRAGPVRALLITTLIGAVSFGLVYGIMWYFVTYLPSTGKPLIELGP